jgi:hypothetical protein
MTSIWNGLLCLHGYITDPQLARRLMRKQTISPTKNGGHRSSIPFPAIKKTRWYMRLCLGIGDGCMHRQ